MFFLKRIILYILLISASSCSIKKHLPKNTYLYSGASVNVKKTPDNLVNSKSVKKSLSKITFPKKNKMILGYPYKVGWWYFIGETKKQSGIKFWLRKKLGEPPVLHTSVDLGANAANIQAHLENRGYFRSEVSTDFSSKGYKWKAIYDILLTRPYMLDSIKWILDTSVLSNDILKAPKKESFIKTKKQFDLSSIKAETQRIDLYLKTKGYYYFSTDYIKVFVDSTEKDYKANLFLSVKKETPSQARLPQNINAIMMFPNYTLLIPPPDTSKIITDLYKDVYIRDTVNDFKKSVLVQALTYRPGSLYNLQTHNESLNRLIKMDAFKFVKSRYEPAGNTSNLSQLNVYYYLTPLQKKNIRAEIGAFKKSNSFTGAQVNINWINRNLLKGAEKLNIKTYGAFETSPNDSLKNNNNFRIGSEVSLSVPRLVTPFYIKDSSFYPPVTKFSLSFEWVRRQLLYTKNFFRFQYDLAWKKRINKEHTFSPASVVFNNTYNFSDTYINKINNYPVLKYANFPEIILGSFYNFTYTSTNPNADNIYYFNGNMDIAGNIAGLINKASAPFSKKIAGAYYAQYAKFDIDFRYSRKLSKEVYLASRFAVGAGFPYGNSAYLPFSKQFIIGGGNSLRGFQPRQLGPGRVFTTADQQVAYPQIGGDFKLEIQTELRFPLVGPLKGALFAEAGNIWSRNDLLFGEKAKFNKDFLKDLGTDAGAGLRFDINILLIRFDVAVPLRKPWLPLGSERVNIDLSNRDYRKNNIVYNIGIGYPF